MKDIKGYEGLYAVTSCGKIWSYRSKKFLKPKKNSTGYLQVNLCKDGSKKTVHVHRMVADAYLLPPSKDMVNPTVDHIDGNKEHNYINNLQWLSNADNIKKSNCKEVICVELNKCYSSISAAARENGIHRTTISQALHGFLKTADGYTWRWK